MKRQPRTTNQTYRKSKTTKQTPQPRGCLLFPQVNGKQVESVELWLDSDERVIIISFQDRTCLHFDLMCDLAVNADYFDWRTGEQRVMKRWRPVQRT
jgi:hypothetical protein